MNTLPARLDEKERAVIEALYQSDRGLAPYTLYRRFSFTPGTLAKLVRKLSSMELVEIYQDRLQITKSGRNFLLSNIYSTKKKDKPWTEMPPEFQGPRIEVDTPYVPERSRLHVSLKR